MASAPGSSSAGQSALPHFSPQAQQVLQFTGPTPASTSPPVIPPACPAQHVAGFACAYQPPLHAATSEMFSFEPQIQQAPQFAGPAPVSTYSLPPAIPPAAGPAPASTYSLPPTIPPAAGPVAGFAPVYQQLPPHVSTLGGFSFEPQVPQFAGPAPASAYLPPPTIPPASGPAHIYRVGGPLDLVTFGPYRYGNSAEVSFHIDVHENRLIKTITDRNQESLTYDEQGFLNMRFNIARLKLESLAEKGDYHGLMRLGCDEGTFFMRELDYYQHKRDYVKAELRGAIMWHQMHAIPTHAHFSTENYIGELRKALQLYVMKHVALKKEYEAWLEHFESAKHRCCELFTVRYGYGIL